MQRNLSLAVEEGGSDDSKYDEDGHIKRTGNVFTASAHIITSIIGSGVLSLAWAIAQLGSVAGPVAMVAFAVITLYTSLLLADCYRSPDGKRNYTYMDAVRTHLGGMKFKLCGLAQYATLIGLSIGYAITTALSLQAIARTNCYHFHGRGTANCIPSKRNFILMFGAVQVLLSQIPNFHQLSFLSIVAAIMSFGYSSIGLGLSAAQIASGVEVKLSATGVPVGANHSIKDKMFSTFSALGNIALAFAFSFVLIEIQDTLRSSPRERRAMKQATSVGILVASVFYLLCGILGYLAFGNHAPGNLLTDDHGFYEPFWVVDLANVCIIVHLVGAYQVFSQPFFALVESWSRTKWMGSQFITQEHTVHIPFAGDWRFSPFRLAWRTAYVVFTTVVALIFPFFNAILGLLGSIAFWPLTIYFPIEMYISQAKIPRLSFTWIWLQILSLSCFVVSVIAAVGSVRDLIDSVMHFKPFE
ncbi:amino acid permease 6-like [Ipomoea triloba]|uniref:amino acid permease 6-like n=1 Tax=Ipomoea triloba TaxID=35885 RepID=UPI00125D5024|nr:amino acid permease 6-like [Ipomoea triloba]XP_031131246.1 amino acid permease 6-like [Ipomoea triloba]